MAPRFACLILLFTGCSSAAEPTVTPAVPTDTGVADTAKSPSDTATPADAGPTDAGEAKADTGTTPDTSTPTDVAVVDSAPETAPPMPVDCFSGSFGPSSGTFVDFLYQQQVGSCESSACSDFIMFTPACEMTLQVVDVPMKATVEAGDCTLLKRWLTSDLLISHLRDMTTCYYGKDGPSGAAFESTSVILGYGVVQKKTWTCSAEPFASHRRCLTAFRAKYFPGK